MMKSARRKIFTGLGIHVKSPTQIWPALLHIPMRIVDPGPLSLENPSKPPWGFSRLKSAPGAERYPGFPHEKKDPRSLDTYL